MVKPTDLIKQNVKQHLIEGGGGGGWGYGGGGIPQEPDKNRYYACVPQDNGSILYVPSSKCYMLSGMCTWLASQDAIDTLYSVINFDKLGPNAEEPNPFRHFSIRKTDGKRNFGKRLNHTMKCKVNHNSHRPKNWKHPDDEKREWDELHREEEEEFQKGLNPPKPPTKPPAKSPTKPTRK
jgi:hypothetical protein